MSDSAEPVEGTDGHGLTSLGLAVAAPLAPGLRSSSLLVFAQLRMLILLKGRNLLPELPTRRSAQQVAGEGQQGRGAETRVTQ